MDKGDYMKHNNKLPGILTYIVLLAILYISSVSVRTAEAATTGTVSAKVANIRSTANTNATIAGTAYKGTNLTILAQSGEWYQVQCGPVQGWMHQSVVSKNGAAFNPVAGPASPIPGVTLDGQAMSFDVPPVVENDRILVPMAAIFRAMGATVEWNEATQTVTAVRGSTRVILPINSYTPTVNGVVWRLDVPARVVNNRTLAPLRFVGEALGGTVIWDAANNTARLTSPPQLQENSQPVVAVNTGSNTVNLRGGPETSYAVVDTAGPGETLKVLGQQNDWYLVNRGARNAWVAGWVVALVHKGEDIPAAAEPPPVNPPEEGRPTPDPTPLPGGPTLSVSTQRTGDGIKVIMESAAKSNPTVNKSSGQMTYNFKDLQVDAAINLKENLGTSNLTVTGNNDDGDAMVTIKFPVWIQYQTKTENDGKRQVFLIPNSITAVSRKTFGSGGENISLATTGSFDYTSSQTSTKLVVTLNKISIGAAQANYSFNSPLISSVTFKAQTGASPGTIMTITTKQAAKFAVGTAANGCGLTIMFIDQKQLQSASSLVVLDAGHGGYDPGASGDKLAEKTANLAVVQKVGKLLTAKGIKVVYTRQDDTYLGLDERSDLANLYNAAVFVSVHCNASTSSLPSGTETYCYYPESDPQLYLQKEERYNLALRIQQAMIAALGTVDRGVKQGNLSVLRKTDMPSALVEMAFISNPAEEAQLQQSQFRDKAAQAIADGINSYMKAYVK